MTGSSPTLVTVWADGRAPRVQIEVAAGPQVETPTEAANGLLEGRVVDASGAPVADARVYVRGWSGEARTDAEGRFSASVPVGLADVSVLRTGYAARSVEAVPVLESGGTPVTIELTESGLALQEFRVTVPRIQGGEATLLAERRDTSEVVDSLSAEQMSRRGDNSAASALQRVTGLTVVGGRYVYVRGLGERYSASLFNGATLPSPEPSRRVVPLDLFPTAMLESVVIQKTYSPSMPGEFGGGVVRLRTRGVPEEPLLKVSLSGTYLHDTSFQEGWGVDRGPTDWLGFGAADRALPAGLERATRNTPLQLRSNLPGSQGFTAEELDELGKMLPNTWGLDRVTARPNLRGSLVAGRGVDIGEDVRLGAIFGTTLRNSWQHLRYRSVVYSLEGEALAPDKSYRFDELSNRVGLSAILHLSAELGEDHTLSTTTTLTRDSESTALEGYGYEDDIGTDTRRQREQWVERQLFVQQAAGEHAFARLEADWRYALSLAERQEPDRRDILMQPAQDTGDWYLRYQGGGHGIFFSELGDTVHDGGLDLSLPWGPEDGEEGAGAAGLHLGGAQQVNRTRGVDVRRFRYDILSGGDSADWSASPRTSSRRTTSTRSACASPRAPWPPTTTPRSTRSGGSTSSPRPRRPGDGPAARRAPRAVAAGGADLPAVQRGRGAHRRPAPDRGRAACGDGHPAPVQGRRGAAHAAAPRLRPDRQPPRPPGAVPSTYFDPRTGREAVGNPDSSGPSSTTSMCGSGTARATSRCRSRASPSASRIPSRRSSRWRCRRLTGTTPPARSTTASRSTSAVPLGQGGALDAVYLSGNAAFISGPWTSATSAGRRPPRSGRCRQSPWVLNGSLSYESMDAPVGAALLYNVVGPRITQVGTNGVPDQIAWPVHRLDAVVSVDLGAGWSSRVSGRNLLDAENVETVGDEVALRFRTGWQVGLGLRPGAAPPGRGRGLSRRAPRGAAATHRPRAPPR